MLQTTIDGSGWSIGGIITNRGGLLRNILRKDANTGEVDEDVELFVAEPSGLIRFAGIGTVTNLIEQGSPNQ